MFNSIFQLSKIPFFLNKIFKVTNLDQLFANNFKFNSPYNSSMLNCLKP